MTRYFVGFLLAVGLIIVVIILIIRGLTSGPHAAGPLDLNSYSNSDVKMQLTIDNHVSASATHNDVIITVGADQTTLLVTKGYQGEIVRMQTYPMNESAYAVFLHALTLNGFNLGNNDRALSDERGQCALHDRFIYEVLDGNGNDLERYWHTSCGTGTFKGAPTAIQSLFTLQVPDYNKLVQGIQLY
jgi:hypothetical protein